MTSYTWTSDAKEAEREQRVLRPLVSSARRDGTDAVFSHGLAIGTSYEENTGQAIAVAVPFRPDGSFGKGARKVALEVPFPYVPGLLAFRVGPAICAILDEVEDDFDLLLFDGQGIAHPRRIGLAAHIGVLYDKMSVGVTRNHLYGRVLDPPDGDRVAAPILDRESNEIVGHSLIAGEDCEPIYISPGHRLSVDEALHIVERITGPGSCFPRSLARAHAMANSFRKEIWQNAKKGGEYSSHA